MPEIDKAKDWAGEARFSPQDDNTFVLRAIHLRANARGVPGDYLVRVNDVFGGHVHYVGLDVWLNWKKV